MSRRLDYYNQSPDGVKGLLEMEKYIRHSSLEDSLIELVKLRASQINGCAYCMDMHTKDARRHGETEQRLYTLSAWRETDFFTEREQAALEWTEKVTQISFNHIDDELYEKMLKHFSEKELIDLTINIIAINGWNRLAISFKTPAGSYKG
ncbi:MAG: carboxymuconolactone decarboxylase family protein [Sphaerochaetaceae bacterium]|jgi:AhpD family alkylhydroperoxidase